MVSLITEGFKKIIRNKIGQTNKIIYFWNIRFGLVWTVAKVLIDTKQTIKIKCFEL